MTQNDHQRRTKTDVKVPQTQNHSAIGAYGKVCKTFIRRFDPAPRLHPKPLFNWGSRNNSPNHPDVLKSPQNGEETPKLAVVRGQQRGQAGGQAHARYLTVQPYGGAV